jgi:lysophospholipase L1-like esterase
MPRRLIAALCTGLASLATAPSRAQEDAPALSLNLPQAWGDTKAAAEAGDADVLVLGDSLSTYPGSYLPYLRARLQTKFGDGGVGYQGFSLWTGASFAWGWSLFFINTDNYPHWSLDGLASVSAPLNTGLGFIRPWGRRGMLHVAAQPGAPFAIFQVGARGPFSVDLNAPTRRVLEVPFELAQGEETISVGADWSVRNWTLSEAEGFGPRSPAPEREQLVMLGVNNVSGGPGIRVHRAANGGWGVPNFLNRNWTFDEQVRLIAPDSFVIMLGQNDGRFPPDLWEGMLRQLLDRLAGLVPTAEVILISSYNSGSPNGGAFAQAMRRVATDRTLGFIDLYAAGGPRQTYVDNAYLADGLHFSEAGGRYVANILYDALDTGGQSLGAPCNDLDFNNDGIFPDNADLADFLAVFAGGACPTLGPNKPGCDSLDFNRDAIYPDTEDITALFEAFAGAPCGT